MHAVSFEVHLSDDSSVQNEKLSCRRRSAHNRMISLLNTAQMFSELYLKRLAVGEYFNSVCDTQSVSVQQLKLKATGDF